jgi:hypothetical protein
MKSKLTFMTAGGLIAVVVVVTAHTFRASTAPVSFLDALRANHVQETVGVDGIHCWKVALSESEFLKAVDGLTPTSRDSTATTAANCQVSWWDIDFPKQAQLHWLSEDGNIRKLASYRNGLLYFVHEHR